MNPKTSRRSWRLLAGSLALLAAGAPSSEAQTRIRLGTLVPQGTSYHQILLAMGERWRACPDGGGQLTVFAGGVLGSEAAMVRRMRIGQINAAMLTAAGLAEIDREVSALQMMPMMFRSLEEVEHVRSRLENRLTRGLREKGFVVLSWGAAGWVQFFSRDPGTAPDDIRRMKMFVGAGDATQIDLMRQAGMNVVPLEWNDALTSLKTGIIDVVPTVPFHALGMQFYTVTKHVLEVNFVPLVGATIVARGVWEGLSPAARACMEAASAEAGARMRERGLAENREAIEAMKSKHQVQVHALTPAVEAQWRRAAEEHYDSVRGKLVPADVFDEVQRLLAEFRSSRAQGSP